MELPRVYPIVDSAAWIQRLAQQGVRLVQLRIKDQPDAAIAEQVASACAISRAGGVQLVINDHWRQALAHDCDFVHLGQEDLDAADLPALRRAGVRLGISTHNEAELERALALRPHYVALGPVYHTTLKVMPWQPQGLARVSEWKRRIGELPLVAIGGITLARLPGVFSAGADVAAVVSDIVTAADPEGQARRWLAAAAASEAVLT